MITDSSFSATNNHYSANSMTEKSCIKMNKIYDSLDFQADSLELREKNVLSLIRQINCMPLDLSTCKQWKT